MSRKMFIMTAIALVLVVPRAIADAPVNAWVKLADQQICPRRSPALIWSAELKRFTDAAEVIPSSFSGEPAATAVVAPRADRQPGRGRLRLPAKRVSSNSRDCEK